MVEAGEMAEGHMILVEAAVLGQLELSSNYQDVDPGFLLVQGRSIWYDVLYSIASRLVDRVISNRM